MKNIQNRATKWYLVLVALLDFMGLGVVVAIFPHMLLDGHFLPQSWGHKTCLTALGVFLAVYPLGQFFGASVLGKLSDIYGRKKLMVLTLFGTFIAFVCSGIAIIMGSAITLLLSRVVAGVFAGNVAIAQASMSDISGADEKTKNLTSIQIALGLAWVFGPPLGGWASEVSLFNLPGFVTSFWLMAALLFLAIIYTLFFYNETLVHLNKKEKVHPLSGITQIIEAFSNEGLRLPFLIWIVFVAGWWLFEAFLPVYLLKKFDFSSGEIGNFLASMGTTYALFQYLVVNKLAKRIRAEIMVKSSLCISALAVLGVAIAHNSLELHVAITIFVTSMGFALPGLITSISNLASKSHQGEIMGNISSTQALATVLMMMIGGYLDNSGITITIFIGGALLLMSWIMFVLSFKKQMVNIIGA
jgi:DHA1 family tetracycline resistance protein-like MFS transporter